MLYTRDYIFIHFPKAAGKTLTRYFLGCWKGERTKGYVSKGQLTEVADLMDVDVDLELGNAHMDLRESLETFSASEFGTAEPKAIFICSRNPYDLAVSTYFFQRATYEDNKGRKNFELASRLSLKEYWRSLPPISPQNYFSITGSTPDNLEVIRFERLEDDLRSVCRRYGFQCPELEHLNATQHDHYTKYYDAELEKMIFERYRFFFDNGFYERETFARGDDN